jgi:hypothetical protein
MLQLASVCGGNVGEKKTQSQGLDRDRDGYGLGIGSYEQIIV